jgi:Fe-S oxidoreductase
MCCGAGGAQMFKEEEKGSIRVNEERVTQLLDTGATKIIANCPFCITMLQDGVKAKDKQDEVTVYDISEWIIQQNIF